MILAQEEGSHDEVYGAEEEDSEERTMDAEMISEEEERQRLDNENMSIEILHQGKAFFSFRTHSIYPHVVLSDHGGGM